MLLGTWAGASLLHRGGADHPASSAIQGCCRCPERAVRACALQSGTGRAPAASSRAPLPLRHAAKFACRIPNAARFAAWLPPRTCFLPRRASQGLRCGFHPLRRVSTPLWRIPDALRHRRRGFGSHRSTSGICRRPPGALCQAGKTCRIHAGAVRGICGMARAKGMAWRPAIGMPRAAGAATQLNDGANYG
jgi:hypothetical protein